jgi:hypothetical protein
MSVDHDDASLVRKCADTDVLGISRLLFRRGGGTGPLDGSVGGSGATGGSGAMGGSGASGGSGGTGGSGATGGSSGAGGAAGASGSDGGSAVLHCESSTSDSCICIEAGGGNEPTPGVTCTSETVGGGFCCADIDYPSDGTCQCSQIGCFNGSICSCGYGTGTDTACEPSFAYCCVQTSQIANPTYCSCGSFPCTSSETQVTSCSVDVLGCNGAAIKVAACTPSN